MPSDQRIRLLDKILDRVRWFEQSAYALDEQGFAETFAKPGVERMLCAIGQTAVMLSHDEKKDADARLEDLYPDVPWAEMRGLGNTLDEAREGKAQRFFDVASKLGAVRIACETEIVRLRHPQAAMAM